MFCSSYSQKKLIQQDKQSITLYPLPDNSAYAVQVVDKLSTVAEIWDELAPKDNIFLRTPYLGMLEQYAPKDMGFRYVIYYQNTSPVGISYMQTFQVSAEESIQNQEEDTENSACIIKAFVRAIKKWFIKRADFNVLICGNLLLTGEFGYHFAPSVSQEEASQLVNQGMDCVHSLLEQSEKVHIQLFKDYLPESTAIQQQLKADSYSQFVIQPSMYMQLPAEWKTFDDYLGAMRSKYRTRARRAAKKGQAIQKKELSLNEIRKNEERIYNLYKSVADGAGFNAFLLHKNYFSALKASLGNDFKLIAYYIDDELVAFYTGILNTHELEAHFLGVDERKNYEYQIYLNILYDLVRMGIYHQKERIDFARTALAIKSSVGAVPQDMYCYMRHRNSLSSKFLKAFFDYLNPKEEWKQRHPFKEKDLVV